MWRKDGGGTRSTDGNNPFRHLIIRKFKFWLNSKLGFWTISAAGGSYDWICLTEWGGGKRGEISLKNFVF